MFYRQCKLIKSNTVTTSWIPEKFAKKGKYIRLRSNKGDEWDDGWQVVEVGARMLDKQVAERSQDYKHQREASDI